MCEHDMEENKRSHVEIHDLEPQVFKAMLGFIDTRRHQNWRAWQMPSWQLLTMYGLEHLKVLCEDVLCRDLSVENAAHTLFLADHHSSGQLKTQTMSHYVAMTGTRLDSTNPGKAAIIIIGRDGPPKIETWEKKGFLGKVVSA
ncbi:hypothetical protein STEG23_000295 [Scotinomys teguina]